MENDKFSFNLLKSSDEFRLGVIKTSRGVINTPVFMPVGTQATVKGVFIDDIIKTGSQIILSNTYHLMLRPGVERISSLGGLHEFMNCKLPILTDSGGFQVMSLSKLNKIDRKLGAIFKSHIDGKEYVLSPEESIKIQKGLNSDILMVMDECPKKTDDYKLIKKISKSYSNKFCNAIGFGLAKESAMDFSLEENKQVFKKKKGINQINKELLAEEIAILVIEKCGYPINLSGEKGILEFRNYYLSKDT